MAWLGDALRDHGGSIDLVGFGALNWDRLLQVPTLENPDTEYGPAETAAVGGSAANSVIAAARLGLSTAYVGAVGDDRPAERLLHDFATAGVNAEAVAVKRNSESGEAICVTDAHGRRLILVQPHANSSFDEDDCATAIKKVSEWKPAIVHLSSFVDLNQIELQVRFLDALATTSPSTIATCSPGYIYVRHGETKIKPLLERSRLLFFNRLEVTKLAGYPRTQYETAASHLLVALPRCEAIVVTLGRGQSGSPGRDMEQLAITAMSSSDDEVGHPSSVVVTRTHDVVRVPRSRSFGRVIDSTGAGDAYAGGFLFGLAQGWSVHDCALAGHVVAQCSVLGLGARATLPDRAEFDAMFSELHPLVA